ncbi:MAG: hypothetical protein NE334_01050 [Lentisphaeraceae bacterium]|nr:hypothetical protein [Lentisphaeraceae bacterium]
MLKTLIQTIVAIFSSFAVIGSVFWFILTILWFSQKTNEAPIAWGNIALAFAVLFLGVFGLYISVKKIKAERKRIREKMKILDKIESREGN